MASKPKPEPKKSEKQKEPPPAKTGSAASEPSTKKARFEKPAEKLPAKTEDKPTEELISDYEDDGPEAWSGIFGGQSGEREQAYIQLQVVEVNFANEDGEAETLEGGFTTPGIKGTADEYDFYARDQPVAPHDLAVHFASRTNAIQHNADLLQKHTRVAPYLASLFSAAFETGIMIGGAPTIASKKSELFVDPENCDVYEPEHFIFDNLRQKGRRLRPEKQPRHFGSSTTSSSKVWVSC